MNQKERNGRHLKNRGGREGLRFKDCERVSVKHVVDLRRTEKIRGKKLDFRIVSKNDM